MPSSFTPARRPGGNLPAGRRSHAALAVGIGAYLALAGLTAGCAAPDDDRSAIPPGAAAPATGITAAGGGALMVITPNQMRGQATAIYYFIISLAGLTLGPTSVAVLTDYVFGDEAALRYSMAVVGFLAPLLSVVTALLIRRSYLAGMDETESWNN